ncbi:hypothetical protein [Natrarchaeobaculum sulfurireducens]|uniref:Uncharacterized protein n=1 Tax=Natrarchaeobaculum sulfurireducens TaxID=2044521 RepID=A0A346P9Y8_9EURY|nr:hypothetical protein [Natrarchaeobaculum sulfurireducens]AXR76333.1 hypothetical protein AArc1_5132 [Natrarchaeobaculum sulfurireducens]AXR80017.1 hypothetical protein AArcMg_4192 [Natrarchaeobaculum sulfurireducens]
MSEVLTAETWIGMGVAVVMFWGVASWAMIRTFRQEEKKISIVEDQRRIDTYSPNALEDLREWIHSRPDDPDVEVAREQYNECVDVLKSADHRFYDWSDDEVESLERL